MASLSAVGHTTYLVREPCHASYEERRVRRVQQNEELDVLVAQPICLTEL